MTDQEEEQPRIATVILALGSNEGDRIRYLEKALGQLRREIKLERISSIYETQPVGVVDQDWFLNLVCMGITRFKPRALLEYIQGIEYLLERRRGERFGPRTLDIDILFYEDSIVEEADLKIPHPRLLERRFVLEPLAEIAPTWRHPSVGKTVRELLDDLDGEAVRLFASPPPISGSAPPL